MQPSRKKPPLSAQAWNAAVTTVVAAAADTAEFLEAGPLGRDRAASIRRLKHAIDHLAELEASARIDDVQRQIYDEALLRMAACARLMRRA